MSLLRDEYRDDWDQLRQTNTRNGASAKLRQLHPDRWQELMTEQKAIQEAKR